MRLKFFIFLIATPLSILSLSYFSIQWLWLFLLFGPLIILGIYDIFQEKHAILRNFPIMGHFRYLFEKIRPEINQYFIESNSDGAPFSREQRSLVYQRSKKTLDTLPFGTQRDVSALGYEWAQHSLKPLKASVSSLRVFIGGAECEKPYNASLLNASAMSYGSLSKNAVMAINGGARDGNFFQNTGEGGITEYHKKFNGDLVWQIGTGYFGCRTADGKFCLETFRENSQLESVKMIEIKISQGAKPGHGGILPAEKLSPEIARIRGVSFGKDIISPPSHQTFSSPKGLLNFIVQLREASGGKPVGFKLCIGKKKDFIAICKAMLETGITPDFITIDGGEGGTGAAPLEFSNHVGMPSLEATVFVNNILKGFGLRKKIKIISAGKITSAFGMIKFFCLGADAVNSARAMMMAVGCIQALKCHSNLCPTGVATQDKRLVRGLVVKDKRQRLKNFHEETMESLSHTLGAMGLKSVSELRPWHIVRRVSHDKLMHYGEIFKGVEYGCFLKGDCPSMYKEAYVNSSPDKF